MKPGIPDAMKFHGGNLAVDSIYHAAQLMARAATRGSIESGGSLTVNGVALGDYTYRTEEAGLNISTGLYGPDPGSVFFAGSTIGPGFFVLNGNTIITDEFSIPERLFAVMYVRGNLSFGLGLMNMRGSNHSGVAPSDGLVTPGAIRTANGTFSAVTNPEVPAAGGAGGAGQLTGNTAGNPGSAGSGGGSGGGGSGGNNTGGSGNGAAGTSFSGGAATGGYRGPFSSSLDAGINGGAGTDGVSDSGASPSGGGAGNPAGAGAQGGAAGAGLPGGTLVIIVEGTILLAGFEWEISVAGRAGGSGGIGNGGGGGGGGSLTILAGSNGGGYTMDAAGGAGGAGDVSVGGAGGAGTARVLIL